MHYNLFELLQGIPVGLTHFILITVFSLILGLSQRHLHSNVEEKHLFGTDRTFTFIGILGYILIVATPGSFYLYTAGGFVIATLLVIYYIFKIKQLDNFGITTVLEAILTYCLPLVLETQPFWMFLLYTVVLLIFTESKGAFVTMSEKLDRKEFLTLTKFLVMAGLILPIVPDTPFVSFLAITPYKIWLAVVVISSISYISYLLRKFVFKDSGLILSGILGGLYSSTATTVVLARKLKLAHSGHMQYAATIIMATGMMYLRVGILMLIFNKALFLFLALAMGCMVVLSFATGGVMLYLSRKHTVKEESTEESDKNPLEFKVAVIFTLIYVIFTFLTFYTIQEYGIRGLNILSVFVGVADIDPFLLNLFQGKYQVTMAIIGSATFTAIISNNVAKMLYASFLAGHKKSKYIYIAFGIIIIMNLLFLLLL